MRARRRPQGFRADGYLSGRTHTSVRRERIAEVYRWLSKVLKEAIEAVCELNHDLLARNVPHQRSRGSSMIEMRRTQLSFGDGLIAEEVSDLREDGMAHADEVLADEDIVAAVYEALAKRHPKSRCRGLKHIRNWSNKVLECEVCANLAYRDFTHVGGANIPDARTMERWGVAIGPEVLKQVDERIVKIAKDKVVTAGRRVRVDTTVVETDIHHPTTLRGTA
jgi:hypothetical protein